MKIPHIQNPQINRAVKSTLVSGRKVIRSTKNHIKQTVPESRRLMMAVLFLSGGLNPAPTSKLTSFLTAAPKLAPLGSDLFEHKTAVKLVKDCIGSNTNYLVKKTASKVKAKISAKNTLLMDTTSKTPEELNELLNSILIKRKNVKNPILNKAHVFIAKGRQYGVNPVVLMAISMSESARGTSVAAIKKNNIGGLIGSKGLMRFENVDDCIEKMAQTIAKHHNKSNINTILELGHSGKYCNKNAAEEWIKNVMFYVRKLST